MPGEIGSGFLIAAALVAMEAVLGVGIDEDLAVAAALQLLSESGLGGVSIDEVSRRSGVAKTTIYRHWSSRTALLLDACSGMASPAEAPETGSLRGDLTLLAGNLARVLRTARWPCILPSIIDTEANRKAMPNAKHERWVKPENIARTIAYLCSDSCSVTSGSIVPVYGRA